MLTLDANGVGALQTKIQDEVDILSGVLDLMAGHDSSVSPPSIREMTLGVFRRLKKLADDLEVQRKHEAALEQRSEEAHRRELIAMTRPRVVHPRQNHNGDGPCAGCAPPGPLRRPTEIECVACGVPAGQPCRRQTADNPEPYYCRSRQEACQ